MEELNAEPFWLARQTGVTIEDILHMTIFDYDIKMIALSEENKAREEAAKKSNPNKSNE